MQQITIKDYKCFSEKTVPLKSMTVLAGGNSVGKSSVIQSLLLLRNSIDKEQTSLNGDYLLNLGNSSQVLRRGANDNKISVSYQTADDCTVSTLWTADIGRPEVYLRNTVKEHDASCELTAANFHYLHAERLGPRAMYNIGSSNRNVGWQGENAIALLSNLIIDTPEYNVAAAKQFYGSQNPTLRSQTDDWMNYIIPGVDLQAQRVQEINQAFVQYNEHAPYNVGFGISYVLPVVVAGLIAQPGEMLIVENPEAHLHPSGQSRIGRFLAHVAQSGVQVITETHSEHVINGIRLAALNDRIDHNNIVVNFFSKADKPGEQPATDSIFLNKQADLEQWPAGFFDQQQRDLGEIFKLRRNQTT